MAMRSAGIRALASALALLLAGGSPLFACGLTVEGARDDAEGGPGDIGDGAAAEGASGAEGGTQPGADGAVDAMIKGDGAPSDGAISDGAPADPYATRVTAGLYALYEFEENTGTTARDAIPTAYDLTIADAAKVTWHPHYLELKDYTSLSNAATFTKLVTRGQATHEVTMEAWVKITGVTGGGSANYGRLVSIIQDTSNRDIDMGQHGTSLWASLESSSTQIERGPVAVALNHVVLTRTAADQTLRLYVNGTLSSSASGVGDPASFVGYRLFVGNSFNGDRGITGDLHLLAFYSGALTPLEVAKNYAAGADPAK